MKPFFVLVSVFASLTAAWNDKGWLVGPGGGAAAAGWGVAGGSWDTLELTPAQHILAAVPAAERGNFLLYQLALAINSGNFLDLETIHEDELMEELNSNWLAAMANEFQHIEVYDGFPIDLQNWLMDSYGLSVTDVYHSSWWRSRSSSMSRSRSTGNGNGNANANGYNTRQQMCTAEGQCYDMAQIVTVCCPF
ncbi:uncharacterized protein Dwil_GK12299 [Drosophila willistoni]|uniref:Uncharacterized protein n=1 Tax=Drosophila willistoni TaxID=7260 RepID=B4N6K7_DROWI|nr:uncharacterized protein LOC6646340 [Drosophila willistoni]XP_046867795.1 uncharacterized protein LOC6646340 [Drosophila willistoni]EDW79996.1 uncharacterized protein Dwil_GK12299 [Drosophila willistoni]